MIRRLCPVRPGWWPGAAGAEKTAGAQDAALGRPLPAGLPLQCAPFAVAPATARQESGRRTQAQAEKEYEQAVRQRWRALALAIKAKLEMVESGITTLEQEFLAYIVLPSGQSVGEWLAPQMERADITGRMPALLPLMEE